MPNPIAIHITGGIPNTGPENAAVIRQLAASERKRLCTSEIIF